MGKYIEEKFGYILTCAVGSRTIMMESFISAIAALVELIDLFITFCFTLANGFTTLFWSMIKT